jgi:hypothetical protein
MAQIRNGEGRGKLQPIYRKTSTVAPLPVARSLLVHSDRALETMVWLGNGMGRKRR